MTNPDLGHWESDDLDPPRIITVGFNFTAICFPLYERENWGWGRQFPDQLFSVGPMRLGFRRETATRR